LAAHHLETDRLIPSEGSVSLVRGLASLLLRLLAFWFGLWSSLNVIVNIRHPAFDANVWWLDLRRFTPGARQAFMAILGVVLIAFALRPGMRPWRRTVSIAIVGLATVAAVANVVTYYRLWHSDVIDGRSFVPLSALFAVLLVGVAVVMFRPPGPVRRGPGVAVVIAGSLLFVVAMPMLQMAFFGTTDYRRPADVIVVFGARVDPGPKASIVLADRVTTASELYREGLAPTIIMSGGVEPSGYDETTVMRDLAISQGVPAGAIVVDPGGVNTQASVDDTSAMFRERGLERVLAVSQFYHLPRIKLAYARAGWDVWTVPSYATSIPQNRGDMLREIPALWLYYVRAAFT
jgi:vancomycin permeability regulator SanA